MCTLYKKVKYTKIYYNLMDKCIDFNSNLSNEKKNNKLL